MRIRRGDTVLIRTGWGRYFDQNPSLYSGDNAAGVGVSGARYLVNQKPAMVGNDTLTFEVRPPIRGPPGTPRFEVFPVHMMLIPDNGINIIENYDLEEIAAGEGVRVPAGRAADQDPRRHRLGAALVRDGAAGLKS